MLKEIVEAIEKQPKLTASKLVVTPNGAFIKRRDLMNLLEICARNGDSKLSVYNPELICLVKSLKRDHQHYLDLEDSVTVGYLIEKGKRLQIPPFEKSDGKLISCKEYLHHKDPMFVNNPHMEAYPSYHSKQYTARFKYDDGFSLLISVHSFEKFVEKVSGKEIKGNPDLNTKRGCLIEMYNHIKEAKSVKRNATLKLMKHNYEEAEYLASNGWIYVVINENPEKILKTCYPKGVSSESIK